MKLLVVDDEPSILEFLKKSLKAEMFAVDTAKNGEDASFMIKANNYDLIILDNILPKKGGPEVCKEIRDLGKSTPILMLSAKPETSEKINLLNLGADDYMTKPFSFEELMARVNALLRRPKQIESVIFKIDDLVLDTKKQMVKRGSKNIYLARKEFSLLEYLMKNQDSVLSRGMILEHVWDMNSDIFSNTIEMHILNLRKKIDLPKKKKLIHTIPGRGYKISLQER